MLSCIFLRSELLLSKMEHRRRTIPGHLPLWIDWYIFNTILYWRIDPEIRVKKFCSNKTTQAYLPKFGPGSITISIYSELRNISHHNLIYKCILIFLPLYDVVLCVWWHGSGTRSHNRSSALAAGPSPSWWGPLKGPRSMECPVCLHTPLRHRWQLPGRETGRGPVLRLFNDVPAQP